MELTCNRILRPADRIRPPGAVRARFRSSDTADFADADRGFIASCAPGVVHAADGRVVWDNDSYAFLTGDAPTSVNPSLWRQSTLVAKQGLYEVTEGIYQVRGLDLSNMTFVEGDTGVIVIDPLISTETAAAALALYREHRGDRPVTAVIYTHSHVDHFGGVFGVTTQDDVDAGKVQIIAPEGFIEHAVEENVYAGTAMARRAGYMYGAALAARPAGPGRRGPRADHLDRRGRSDRAHPRHHRHRPEGDRRRGGDRVPDGAGHRGARRDALLLPAYRALCMAENATHTLHNLLTLRGALVRDPHVWAKYLTEAIETVRRPHRRRLRLPPLADLGPRARRRVPLRRSATCTRTCTTRPCGCSTRATPAPRSPR